MTNISFRVRRFDELTLDELYRVLRLRIEVFVVEQDCPYQDIDGRDSQALHLLGETPSGELVAYARLLPVGVAYPEHAAIGRVITASSVRGTGVGLALMGEAVARVRDAWGQDTGIQLGAQNYALAFYGRLGFEPSGESYLEDGIPHTPMVLRRPPVPPGASSG
jgi:ElaA protein